MQRQIETCNFLAVYFAVSSQNGESPLRDVYQRPEQSRATVPGKNKIAWPKTMPGRLSALMYVRHRILTNFAMKIRQKFVKKVTNEFVIRHF